MDYCEHDPPSALTGLVKCFWTLAADGAPGGWIAHHATPDGCVEIIRRLAGRSRWDGDQPQCFAVGVIDEPSLFEISGDSRFVGVRFWPWAWPLLDLGPVGALRGHWIALADPALAPHDPGEAADLFAARFAGAEVLAATGQALLEAGSVEEMGRATGMAPRTLQRWFARNVGMPPRHYMRLLRFQKAFEQVHVERSLADHAAAQGFADQAHMARTFREMAGVPAKQARRAAKGPFLS